MSIGGVSSAASHAAQSSGQAIEVLKAVQNGQKREGEAAVSLIRSAEAAQTPAGTHKVDKIA